MVIRAVSFKGRPLGQDMLGRFTESGGTIGRGDSSTLVLPDPERYISRTQAAIAFQAGGFVITDSGSKNHIVLNGRPLAAGAQARLADGDQIKIGDYLLEVSLPKSAAAPPAPATQTPTVRIPALPKDDPLAAFGGPSPRADDPFADLLKPSSRAPQPASADAMRPWPEPPQPPAPPPAHGGDPLAGLKGREPSIEELFDLKNPAPDLAADPLAGLNPPDRPGAHVVDPLEQLLGSPPRPVPPPTAPDHGPEIFTPFSPPVARPDPLLQPPVDVQPPAAAVAPPPAGPASAQPSHPSAPAPARTDKTAAGATEAALLRAFLSGAGITGSRLTQLTPETMEVVGVLLRESLKGALDLLRARGLTKSELRADMTMVVAADNNPLKFSPTVEAALNQLLSPPLPGFMPPVRAIQDAYDDLRAHQLGFLAGMRAALDEVLARFAPDQLQERLSDRSVLDSLMPMNRRAKLWALFVECYERVAADAREDFNATFGKAFVRAYEAQVKRLRAESRRV